MNVLERTEITKQFPSQQCHCVTSFWMFSVESCRTGRKLTGFGEYDLFDELERDTLVLKKCIFFLTQNAKCMRSKILALLTVLP